MIYFLFEFLFVALFGTVWHFVYPFSRKLALLAPFAPVNESVFEHVKIGAVPLALFVLATPPALRPPCAALGLLLGTVYFLIFMPANFYAYRRFTGRAVLWIDIASFYAETLIAAAIGYALSFAPVSLSPPWLYFAIAALLAAVSALTYFPPRLPLFLDAKGGFYGIPPDARGRLAAARQKT